MLALVFVSVFAEDNTKCKEETHRNFDISAPTTLSDSVGEIHWCKKYRIQNVTNHCARNMKGARLYDHVTPIITGLEGKKLLPPPPQ